jgi:hypothetical protein
MALLTGAVIYLTSQANADAEARTGAGLRFVPTASPNSAGVVAHTRF